MRSFALGLMALAAFALMGSVAEAQQWYRGGLRAHTAQRFTAPTYTHPHGVYTAPRFHGQQRFVQPWGTGLAGQPFYGQQWGTGFAGQPFYGQQWGTGLAGQPFYGQPGGWGGAGMPWGFTPGQAIGADVGGQLFGWPGAAAGARLGGRVW